MQKFDIYLMSNKIVVQSDLVSVLELIVPSQLFFDIK